MHIFAYFVVVGSTLLALLFYADANLAPRGPLAVTTEFQGLPAPWRGPAVQSLAANPAPAPDMNSEAVLAAATPAPKAGPAVAAATNGMATPFEAKKKKHVARKTVPQDDPGRPRYAWRGEPGPFGGMFGRF